MKGYLLGFWTAAWLQIINANKAFSTLSNSNRPEELRSPVITKTALLLSFNLSFTKVQITKLQNVRQTTNETNKKSPINLTLLPSYIVRINNTTGSKANTI